MLRCKWCVAALLSVTIAIAAGVTYASVARYLAPEYNEQPASIGCCSGSESSEAVSSECPACEKCCPLVSAEKD